MGRTFKDMKSVKQTRKPTKKDRRDLEKLHTDDRYGAFSGKAGTNNEFKSSYKKLKIEE